jgi:hypothetical protein
MDLTATIRNIAAIGEELAAHEIAARKHSDELRARIAGLRRRVAIDGAQLDSAKIDLARTVLYVRGSYARAGEDRASVIQDAITFFAMGPRPHKDLRTGYFGTKNYDRWEGQRSDHPYFMGPSHGSVCFEVGLTKAAQDRSEFTAEEVEACIYVLTRIDAIQSAETAAKQTA